MTLKEVDFKIFDFIKKFGYVLPEQLAIYLSVEITELNKIIKRLHDNDFLKKELIFNKKSPYLLLNKETAKTINTKFVEKPKLNTLAHDTILVSLYLHLKNSGEYQQEDILTDRELRGELDIFKKNNTELYRIPDILIKRHKAIELELTEKSLDRLNYITSNYISRNDITEVHYYGTSTTLMEKIKKIANHSKFYFYCIDSLTLSHLEFATQIFDLKITPLNSDVIPIIESSGLKKFGNYIFPNQ